MFVLSIGIFYFGMCGAIYKQIYDITRLNMSNSALHSVFEKTIEMRTIYLGHLHGIAAGAKAYNFFSGCIATATYMNLEHLNNYG